MSSRIAGALRVELNHALDRLGAGSVRTLQSIGGGCISDTARLHTSTGGEFFLKSSGQGGTPGMFAAEARSLEALAATNTLRVPRVVDVNDSPDAESAAPRWLLLEWLEPGGATTDTWTRLGHSLARLHRAGDCAASGWPLDNFIGSLPQSNASTATWPEFWRERRLRPQLDLALAGGHFDRYESARFAALFAALDDILATVATDGLSLLHGDLWAGNLHILASGEPALLDPSCYCGHREVDLAMTELFGGFPARFREAYGDEWPIARGCARRRPVYQLYYLLVHVNLFGDGYHDATLNAVRSAGF